MPVSYTHLDVYKRQETHEPIEKESGGDHSVAWAVAAEALDDQDLSLIHI